MIHSQYKIGPNCFVIQCTMPKVNLHNAPEFQRTKLGTIFKFLKNPAVTLIVSDQNHHVKFWDSYEIS